MGDLIAQFINNLKHTSLLEFIAVVTGNCKCMVLQKRKYPALSDWADQYDHLCLFECER